MTLFYMSNNNTRRQNPIHRKWRKSIHKYSNPAQAQRMAYRYLGKTAQLYPSSNTQKKYDIYDPVNNHWVHFGQIGYEDYTKHKDKKRRKNYLTRSGKIKGDWKKNKYSANNLASNVLW